jgi:hypothetical protein
VLLLATGADVKSMVAVVPFDVAPRGAELVELWKKLFPSEVGG